MGNETVNWKGSTWTVEEHIPGGYVKAWRLLVPGQGWSKVTKVIKLSECK